MRVHAFRVRACRSVLLYGSRLGSMDGSVISTIVAAASVASVTLVAIADQIIILIKSERLEAVCTALVATTGIIHVLIGR